MFNLLVSNADETVSASIASASAARASEAAATKTTTTTATATTATARSSISSSSSSPFAPTSMRLANCKSSQHVSNKKMVDFASISHTHFNPVSVPVGTTLSSSLSHYGKSDDDEDTSEDDDDSELGEECRLEYFKYNAMEAFRDVKGCDLEIEDEDYLPPKVREELNKIRVTDRSIICLRVARRDSKDPLEQRKSFYESRGVGDTTEAYGFHGTSCDAASAIISLGFRPVKAKNGSACGKGVYLASKLKLSLQPRYAVEENGMQVVLICRFIKGCSKDTSGRDETTNPLEHLTGGCQQRGIHVVWWPNANTDIVVTHVLCLRTEISRREAAEACLNSHGYSIGQSLMIVKEDTSSKMPQKPTSATVKTVRIVRITSKGKVRIHYYEASPDGSMDKIKRKATMPLSRLLSLQKSAKSLLSHAYPAGSTHYPNVSSLEQYGDASDLVVMMPGHSSVCHHRILEIDTCLNRITTCKVIKISANNSGVDRPLTWAPLRHSSGGYRNSSSNNDDTWKVVSDRTNQWTLQNFYQARYIAKRLIDAQAMKPLGEGEVDNVINPSFSFHQSRVACLRFCEVDHFDITRLQEGQLVDAIDNTGSWYHATIMRIVHSDNSTSGTVDELPLVQLTYRVYHASGPHPKKEADLSQDYQKFSGYRREYDEWHLARPTEIAQFGSRSNQKVDFDMLSYEINQKAIFAQKVEFCERQYNEKVAHFEERRGAEARCKQKQLAQPSEYHPYDTSFAQILHASANARKEVDDAREYVNSARKDLELARLEFMSICQSEFQNESVDGCPAGCTCFDCQMRTAIHLSLQEDSQLNTEEDNASSAAKLFLRESNYETDASRPMKKRRKLI